MKKLVLIGFALISTAAQAQSAMVPATVQSLTYDSRAGGAPRPPDMPRPAPVWQVAVQVGVDDCYHENQFSIRVRSTHKEQILTVIRNRPSQDLCESVRVDTDWQDSFSGKVIYFSLENLDAQKPFRLQNPLFVAHALPRP